MAVAAMLITTYQSEIAMLLDLQVEMRIHRKTDWSYQIRNRSKFYRNLRKAWAKDMKQLQMGIQFVITYRP